ncbi:MAG: hypothetical protein LBK99_22090 [Opitutaceae bacterium]|jgi:hypothetical protein|nr:hypothetical protein [Opitutaceae bacterium]
MKHHTSLKPVHYYRLPALRILATVLALLGGIIPPTLSAVTITFDSGDAFFENFRLFKQNGDNPTYDATNGGMTVPKGNNATYVYDTTPADATKATQDTFTISPNNPFTISTTFVMGYANSSIGIYIVNPANEATGYLALYNINASASKDQLRIATNAIPNITGAGTLIGVTDQDGLDLNQEGIMKITYGLEAEGTTGYLSIDLYSSAAPETPVYSFTKTAITDPLTTFEIALRFSRQASDNAYVIKNLEMVPELATHATLAGLALLGIAIFQRIQTRRRR